MTEPSAPAVRPETDPVDRVRARHQARLARTSAGLTSLYGVRGDLRGVSPAAELVMEGVRWSA